jgi:ketosteroid isomerase-like protein
MASVPDPEAAVAAANAAYYAAFEARDLDAMAEVWDRSDRCSVTHPGWPTLHGWARVAGSWDAIFANTAFIQFVLTDEVVHVSGPTAWVTCDENILQSGSSREGGEDVAERRGGRVAASNGFVDVGGLRRRALPFGTPRAGALAGAAGPTEP